MLINKKWTIGCHYSAISQNHVFIKETHYG